MIVGIMRPEQRARWVRPESANADGFKHTDAGGTGSFDDAGRISNVRRFDHATSIPTLESELAVFALHRLAQLRSAVRDHVVDTTFKRIVERRCGGKPQFVFEKQVF